MPYFPVQCRGQKSHSGRPPVNKETPTSNKLSRRTVGTVELLVYHHRQKKDYILKDETLNTPGITAIR